MATLLVGQGARASGGLPLALEEHDERVHEGGGRRRPRRRGYPANPALTAGFGYGLHSIATAEFMSSLDCSLAACSIFVSI